MRIDSQALGWGEPAPWFEARAPVNPRFAFSSLAGRFVALSFIGRASEPAARAFLEAIASAGLERNDDICVSYGVSAAESDAADPLACRAFPPQRIFHDPEMRIASAFGLVGRDKGTAQFRPTWFIFDPTLRVYASGTIDRPQPFLEALRALPHPEAHAGPKSDIWAPVLLVPRVLELGLCRALIEVFDRGQPEASGFMRTEDGKTVAKLDDGFKRRSDVLIEDEGLKVALRAAVKRRIVPEIEKVFQYKVTRIERYIVARYDSHSGGFFKAHRDNTTAGTAHRRFAITINLNAEEYDGGDLRFPEYGTKLYRAPTGGAVVFSCSLLHEAAPVTRGSRYATLPFLYDDEAARLRQANNKFLGDDVGAYKANEKPRLQASKNVESPKTGARTRPRANPTRSR